MLIATVNYSTNTAVVSVVSAATGLLPVNYTNQNSIFLIATRIVLADSTNVLYFSNGSIFTAGQTSKLGAGGGGSGTVTSVGLSLPSIFNVTVSPITTSGTLTATLNTQTMNTFLAGPTSGSAQTPTFRAIVAADIPTLNQNTTGTAYSVTGANVILNSNLAQMNNNTIKGNVSGSLANASDLNATQVTAMLNTFTSSLQGLTPASGGGTTNFLRADGTWTAPSGGGSSSSSSSGKNYLSAITTSNGANNGNGNFELGATTGWSLAHTALTNLFPTTVATAGSAFSNTTGLSGTLTLSVVSSGQLSGSYSGALTQTATSTAGDMLISSPFFIDASDYSKPMTVTFSAKAISGSIVQSATSTNSYALYIYDVTNAAWISPATPYVMDGSGKFTASFQATANSTKYQLALINVNSIATSHTLYVDDFVLGPNTYNYVNLQDTEYDIGSKITGTSTFTNSRSVAIPYKTKDGTWRLRFNISGTQSSSSTNTLTIAGVVFKTISLGQVFSSGFYQTSILPTQGYAPGGDGRLYLQWNSSSSYVLISGDLELDSMPTWAVDYYPVQLSNGAETRVVAASYYCSTNAAVSSSQSLNFDTKVYDTHGAVTASAPGTGTWKFTAPVSGYYRISSLIIPQTATGGYFSLYKNASLYINFGLMENGGSYGIPNIGTVTVSLNAGDYIDVRMSASATAGGGVLNSTNTSWVTIERLSGPATIAASEKIYAEYNSTSGQACASGTTLINFDTKVIDTHNAVTTGASWKFTAPRAGYYCISAATIPASNLSGTGATISLGLYKSGSINKIISFTNTAGITVVDSGTGSGKIYLNAGEYIDIRLSQNAIVSVNLISSTGYVWITINSN
jgi:hypothetical protein